MAGQRCCSTFVCRGETVILCGPCWLGFGQGNASTGAWLHCLVGKHEMSRIGTQYATPIGMIKLSGIDNNINTYTTSSGEKFSVVKVDTIKYIAKNGKLYRRSTGTEIKLK